VTDRDPRRHSEQGAATDESLAAALAQHRAGRLDDAARIYRAVLTRTPDDADALHLLGLVEHQQGRHGTGAELIRRSLDADPTQFGAWTNLVTVLRAAGDRPGGQAAVAAALALAPGHGAAHFARGLLTAEIGAPTDAQAAFRMALALDPDHAPTRANLGAVLLDGGQAVAAEAELRAALETDPGLPDAWSNLGNALREQDRLAEAVSAYHEALRRQPGFAPAFANLGIALLRMGDVESAVAALRQAVRAQPDLIAAHVSMGHALHLQGKLDAAEAACRRALAIAPAHADAHHNLGVVLKDLGRQDEALTAFASALASRPALAVAHSNLGAILREELRLDDALAAFTRAIDLDPRLPAAESNALITMMFMDRFGPDEVFAAHCKYGRRHGAASRPSISYGNVPDPDRRLRVGYLSPQLRAHVLAPSLLPVLEHHRRAEVSVHVFAHVPHPDATTRRMRDMVDEWAFIDTLSDLEACRRIRQSAVDILIDPMGHWADNRLTVLALKPAPIQVTYLCNTPTTGLAAVDFAIVDRWIDFDGRLAGQMTEIPVHLPGGFGLMSYDEEPVIAPPPSIARGHVTFGCYNNPAKISDRTLALWSRVLAAAPTARLLLKGRGLDRPGPQGRLRARMSVAGIAPGRVDLRGAVAAVGEHLASHADIDIALDPLPFTGGRTTVDALWMGVPVVTLPGDALYGRYSYGFLHRIGAPELIAESEDDLVRRARDLAAAPERLADYRQRLRTMVRASSLMDWPRHVAEFEDALRAMWRRWCAERNSAGPRG